MLTNHFFDNMKYVLTKLLGQRLKEIGRAANMLWVGFGDDIIYVNLKGKPIVKSEYALHVQCDWEIAFGNEVVLKRNDFDIPKDKTSRQLFDAEQFGNSRFDKISMEFNAAIKANPTYVVNYSLHMTGELELELSDNLVIKIYPNSPSEGESWRFMMSGSDEGHLVVFED